MSQSELIAQCAECTAVIKVPVQYWVDDISIAAFQSVLHLTNKCITHKKSMGLWYHVQGIERSLDIISENP